MFAGCLQLMSAHLQIIWVRDPRYLQLIRAENRDVCRSVPGCLQVATPNGLGGAIQRGKLTLPTGLSTPNQAPLFALAGVRSASLEQLAPW